jgi:hypothetical protein
LKLKKWTIVKGGTQFKAYATMGCMVFIKQSFRNANAAVILCSAMIAPEVSAQAGIPGWCRPLPRVQYKGLERISVGDAWFVYKVARFSMAASTSAPAPRFTVSQTRAFEVRRRERMATTTRCTADRVRSAKTPRSGLLIPWDGRVSRAPRARRQLVLQSV